jgi:hypothetical protein
MMTTDHESGAASTDKTRKFSQVFLPGARRVDHKDFSLGVVKRSRELDGSGGA